ncbi:MAG: T9SS type A sorting domain-containing protein [Bacteroidota bacterium]
MKVHRFIAVSLVFCLHTVSAQYSAVLFNGTGLSSQDRLTALAIAGIVNRDSARLYLLNVYETWSYTHTDEQWRDLYRSRGNVAFDSIAGISNLVNTFRPFIDGAVTYDPALTYGNFPGQSFLWQGEYAALIGGLTNRIPLSAANASLYNLPVNDSIFVEDPFNADSSRWITGRLEVSAHPWNNASLSQEQRYLTLLAWGVSHLLPLCNPSKFYIREITDFTISHRMFQVNLAGNDDLKLDSMPVPKADILENILTYMHQQNPQNIFHIYGWIRPEPMTQWFAYFGASFHETLLGNLSWHNSFPVAPRSFVPASRIDPDTVTVEEKYYLLFIGTEGDASNWQFSFQSGAWLSPQRGTIPVTWGWNLHLFDLAPFVASYYYDTATPNDGFISVTSPLGFAYPDLWQDDVWDDAVAETKMLMNKYSIGTIYGYKHYEGKGIATYRGKTINNSFNFNRYGNFQKEIGASLTMVYDPLLPLQIPQTQFGGLLFNHCNDGSFYGNVSNISTAASRLLNILKQKSPPYFLLAGYQRFRQDDFGVRVDPSSSDISVPRLQQILSLMENDTTAGKKIEAVTGERFAALLRKQYGITGVRNSEQHPISFILGQNYPNPFNPSTNIQLVIGTSGAVTLTVYDVLGREVKNLYTGALDAGKHTFRFSPQDAGMPSGVYFFTARTGNLSQTRKMIYIR